MIRLVEYHHNDGWRDRVLIILIGLVSIFRGLLEVLSFGVLTTSWYEDLLFSQSVRSWVGRGRKKD